MRLIASDTEMRAFGALLGSKVRGGMVIELVGDVGAGKTTLTKGVGEGMNVDDDVQSPSFTISRTYSARNNLTLAHYDFYRLTDAGIMNDELAETVIDPDTVTVIEWASIVEGVLPEDRLTIHITSPSEESREIKLLSGGSATDSLLKEIE